MGLPLRSPASKARLVTAILTLGFGLVPPSSTVLAQPDDSVVDSSPSDSGAVFDAPGMPGVRMMAPIPDKPDPVPAQPRKPAKSAAAASVVKFDGSDRSLVQQAFSPARDWSRVRQLAGQAHSQAVKLIVEWRYLLDEMGGADFQSIDAFLTAHPNWPRHDALVIRAEKTMPAESDPLDVIAWYAKHPPLSGIGNIRLGTALMDIGKRNEGTALIRKGWTDFTFSPFDERDIVAAHADVLGPAEQKVRLLKLLARDDAGGVKRQMLRVDADTRRLATAISQIKTNPAAVKQVLASFPESGVNEPELVFEAARALRRRNQDEAAWDLMSKAPSDKQDMAIAERWSSERQIMARDALKAGRNDLAYQFASTPALDPESGSAFMDAEFLAGWIALRSLNKPELAYYHFDRLAKGVSFPISVARAHYWLGRTWDALNNRAAAADEYRVAGYYSATFYGQLALTKLAERPMLHVNIAATADPLPSERAAFEADDRVQAIRLFNQLGDRNNVRQFALAIATSTKDEKQLQMLAELVASTGDQALGVKVAKNASYSDVYLQPYLHPLVSLPKSGSDAPEPALVLGLTRQESEFDAGAVSVAGARGLMQLMPASAKRAATLSRLTFRPADLNNPDYNIQLGMATLSEYLDRWGGSYILAIASYNAGPSNVRNWVEAYGDPRESGVDPIDWIESIPYPETRNYVQRVLENLEVYRNRLNSSDQQLVILSDLYRPNTANAPGVLEASSASLTVPKAPAPQ